MKTEIKYYSYQKPSYFDTWWARIFGEKVQGIDRTKDNVTTVTGYKYKGILYITSTVSKDLK